MKLFKTKVDGLSLLKKINTKNYFSRYCFMIFGVFLSALSFNLFFEPYNIVTGGMTGLSLIIRCFWDINPATFVLGSSIILVVISFIFLGFKQTVRTLVGVLLLPFFIETTLPLVSYINLSGANLLLLSIYGGVIGGFASGIIYRNGFSTGGTQIINQLLTKYVKMSMGTATIITNLFIIVGASFVFGIPKSLYAILSLYISSKITDRVILGISDMKTFHIITEKEDEVKDFIINNLSHSVTILDARGGYSFEHKKIIMCVLPTRQYYVVKQVITEIDKEAFFLITDTYEVNGGA